MLHEHDLDQERVLFLVSRLKLVLGVCGMGALNSMSVAECCSKVFFFKANAGMTRKLQEGPFHTCLSRGALAMVAR